jgi:hypothetical protein
MYKSPGMMGELGAEEGCQMVSFHSFRWENVDLGPFGIFD